MREEQITRKILNRLIEKDWQILSFDYPQSGTGIALRAESQLRREKNLKNIIPDIVALRGDQAAIFENKVDFFAPDLESLHALRSGSYDFSMRTALFREGYPSNIFYGIGLENNPKNISKIRSHQVHLDFALVVDALGAVEVTHGSEVFI